MKILKTLGITILIITILITCGYFIALIPFIEIILTSIVALILTVLIYFIVYDILD